MYERAEPAIAASSTIPDDLLTAAEVAALLRMTPAWVYAATRRDTIPHLRLGRYVRYRRSAIQSWMARMEGQPTSDALEPYDDQTALRRR